MVITDDELMVVVSTLTEAVTCETVAVEVSVLPIDRKVTPLMETA
jgi:hypothetical protein